MKRIRLFLIGLFAACLPMLMAPSGGFPSNPAFQTISALSAVGTSKACAFNNSTACFASTGTGIFGTTILGRATGGSSYGLLINAGNASAADFPLLIRSRDNLTTYMSIDGTGNVLFPASDSGTVTWTFNTANTPSCTGTGTNASISLHKIGKVVTGNTGATNSTCTINSGTTNITTNNAPVPAAYRPAASTACGVVGVLIVPATVPAPVGSICVSSAGNFQVFGANATSTSLGFPAFSSFTYTLD